LDVKDLNVSATSLAFALLSLTLCGAAQVSGVVTDPSAHPISAAQVTSKTATATTAGDGSFRLALCPLPCLVTISAHGYAARQFILTANGATLMLRPYVPGATMTVTAERIETSLAQTPQATVALSAEQASIAPAGTLDDKLRQLPGFSLFRRSGSRSANPTTQGATLRGVGGSGASRVLVLRDGIPLNDPFGGWVHWSRLQAEAGDVEIVQGGASHLYGGPALAGVVQQVSRPPQTQWAQLTTFGGNKSTGDVHFSGGMARGKASLAGELSGFRTGGYIPTPPSERGAADSEAGTRHLQVRLRPRWKANDRAEWSASAEWFRESRTNGSRLQDNHTQLWQVESTYTQRMERALLKVRAYGSGQDYDQSFSAISADRNSESQVRAQQVPSQQAGSSLEVSGAAGRHTWLAGSDVRQVRGRSDEDIINAGTITSRISNGGQQLTAGWFASDRITFGSRVLLSAAVRFDLWRNLDAESRTLTVASQNLTVTPLPDRTSLFVSPRLALLFQPSAASTLSLSAYRSFRAPTLNELYRPFRVGNVVTQPNDGLQEESLLGAEGTYRRESAAWSAQVTGFWMRLDDPVTNATLSSTPALIVRRRENLGATRSVGVDTSITLRPSQRWSLTGGYQFSDAAVIANPANAALVGLRVPQVPRHSASLQWTLKPYARWVVSAQLRGSSAQFDDDLNAFRLGAYATVDALVQKEVSANVALFVAAENVLNSRYDVARTPTRSLGPPALVRAGVKIRFPATRESPPAVP
jgi:outer membrane receptor protein involved in Fe transport